MQSNLKPEIFSTASNLSWLNPSTFSAIGTRSSRYVCRSDRGAVALLEGFRSFVTEKCDVFELTLIVASARSGQSDYAGALRGQRVRRKPARADYPHRKPTFTIRFCGNVPK
jgi:hypothetical protein